MRSPPAGFPKPEQKTRLDKRSVLREPRKEKAAKRPKASAAKPRVRSSEGSPHEPQRFAVRPLTSGSGGSGALGIGSYQNVAQLQSSCRS